MATQIQLRRSTSAEWAATNPVLAQGEVGIDLTLGEMRLGDGVTAWAGLTSIGAVDPADVDAAIASYLLAHPPAATPVESVNGQTGAICPRRGRRGRGRRRHRRRTGGRCAARQGVPRRDVARLPKRDRRPATAVHHH